MSFGYKHGLPIDVDLVFDCRFLPNPHWVEELRPLAGTDPLVRDYVLAQPETAPFLVELERLFALLLPAYVREGKSYLSIAFGCTGGRHRSVVIAEQLAERLYRQGRRTAVHHRDVERAVDRPVDEPRRRRRTRRRTRARGRAALQAAGSTPAPSPRS